MEKEIVLRSDYINEKVNTIYFGGGTPSILETTAIAKIFEQINIYHTVANDAEISMEVNPDDISDDKLAAWKALGVNRLSIGIQTFNDAALKYLNRAHTAKEAISSAESAKKYGFENFNIDLIYSLPSPDHQLLKNDLEIIQHILPTHISAYNLTIEPKTVFGNWLKQGKIAEMNEDFATEQYWMMCESLKSLGYEHYEVSNFCLPGFESKHNSSYWKGINYLGIGPGAHSFNGKSRQYNKPNNIAYIKSVDKGHVPFTIETLTKEDIVNEYLLTGLRTRWGVDLNVLAKTYHYTFAPKQQRLLDNLKKDGLAVITNDTLKLTEKGFLLADQIALELSL